MPLMTLKKQETLGNEVGYQKYTSLRKSFGSHIQRGGGGGGGGGEGEGLIDACIS